VVAKKGNLVCVAIVLDFSVIFLCVCFQHGVLFASVEDDFNQAFQYIDLVAAVARGDLKVLL